MHTVPMAKHGSSSCKHYLKESTTNAGDNKDGLKDVDTQVSGQESTSTTNVATSGNASCLHGDKENKKHQKP
eukprot:3667960-Ditylum_brightwellii.AAC.1